MLFGIESCTKIYASSCVYLGPLPRVKLGSLKGWYSWNIMLYWKANYSQLGLNAAKNTHHIKKSFK